MVISILTCGFSPPLASRMYKKYNAHRFYARKEIFFRAKRIKKNKIFQINMTGNLAKKPTKKRRCPHSFIFHIAYSHQHSRSPFHIVYFYYKKGKKPRICIHMTHTYQRVIFLSGIASVSVCTH